MPSASPGESLYLYFICVCVECSYVLDNGRWRPLSGSRTSSRNHDTIRYLYKNSREQENFTDRWLGRPLINASIISVQDYAYIYINNNLLRYYYKTKMLFQNN